MKNEKDFYKCIYFRLMSWERVLVILTDVSMASAVFILRAKWAFGELYQECPCRNPWKCAPTVGIAKLNIFWVSMYRFVRLLVVVFWWAWHIFSVGRTVHAMHPGNQVLIQGTLRVNLTLKIHQCLPNDMPRSWYMDHCTNDFSRGEGEGGMGVCFHRKFWSKIHYSRNIILTFSSRNIPIKYNTPSTSLTIYQHANDYDHTSSTPSIFEIHARDLWDLLCGIR